MVDKPKLDQMLRSLKTYHGELEELAQVPHTDFLSDKHRIGSAKYHFVIAIECCIDIANHVIASENYRFPKSNADSFSVLIEEGVVASSMEDALRAMAQFRNRLVHLYWEVDDELVHRYLQTSLPDMTAFASSVAEFLVRSEGRKGNGEDSDGG
jgi:uncharacterized protein YutE (UPF0331/DUF86 family)